MAIALIGVCCMFKMDNPSILHTLYFYHPPDYLNSLAFYRIKKNRSKCFFLKKIEVIHWAKSFFWKQKKCVWSYVAKSNFLIFFSFTIGKREVDACQPGFVWYVLWFSIELRESTFSWGWVPFIYHVYPII